MLVVVGTEEPLPYAEELLFQIRPLYADSVPLRRLFSKPNLYDLGSVEGCACGFSYSPQDLEVLLNVAVSEDEKMADREAYSQSQASVHLLQQFLRRAVGSGTAEVYSCLIGEECEEPETRLTVDLAHFGGEAFDLVERQFLTISGG